MMNSIISVAKPNFEFLTFKIAQTKCTYL